MFYNSVEFALFLPVVFIIYWAIGYAKIDGSLKLKMQNAFVVVASYIFYGWWDWRFLLLIAFTSFCSWGSGLLIGKSVASVQSVDGHKKARFWMIANIVLNLGILFTFKYYNFFVEEFCQLFPSLEGRSGGVISLILPVGISFYTFQALSYSIDVYRGKIEPTNDIIAFFAFISFFPQLVAGPIERATNLLPQFLQNRKFAYEQGIDGMRQILWGLFKKIVVADNCATYVDQVWAAYDTQSGSTLLLAAMLFTFQIYGDFSGYSDMAIGTAKLFGIKLMRNFNNPYFSRDIAEFWRRWHISLTTWFRDYVYIPLGGSRVNKLITMRNTCVVFLLCGLWHGANWTYMVWGFYHVALFMVLIVLNQSKRFKDSVPTARQLPRIMLTFVFVTIGWIIFRAPSLPDAWGYMCSMTNLSGAAPTLPITQWIGIIFGLLTMIAFEWTYRNSEQAPVPHRWWIYYLLIAAIWWYAPSFSTDFIYFQF